MTKDILVFFSNPGRTQSWTQEPRSFSYFLTFPQSCCRFYSLGSRPFAPPMKGNCSGSAGAKTGMRAANCEVNLTCFSAALLFDCVLTKTFFHSALHCAKLDLNPSQVINLFLCSAIPSPGPDIGKVAYP